MGNSGQGSWLPAPHASGLLANAADANRQLVLPLLEYRVRSRYVPSRPGPDGGARWADGRGPEQHAPGRDAQPGPQRALAPFPFPRSEGWKHGAAVDKNQGPYLGTTSAPRAVSSSSATSATTLLHLAPARPSLDHSPSTLSPPTSLPALAARLPKTTLSLSHSLSPPLSSSFPLTVTPVTPASACRTSATSQDQHHQHHQHGQQHHRRPRRLTQAHCRSDSPLLCQLPSVGPSAAVPSSHPVAHHTLLDFSQCGPLYSLYPLLFSVLHRPHTILVTMVNHRRGPWSQHEDRILIDLVQRKGPHNWVRISNEIGSRTPKQCRERYHQNLKPNLNHNPITQEEGEIIEQLVLEIGKKWAEIARRLPGRSDNAVKNWWNGGVHRRRRNTERQAQRHMQQPSHASHPSHSHQPYPYLSPSHHQLEQPQPLHAYPAPPHHNPHPAHPTQSLPPIRGYGESSVYGESRRPSLNLPPDSPRSLKLAHPHGLEAFPGSRPSPLQLAPLQPFTSSSRARVYETPMPSPGYSIASVDAPSLITDTGSETRSPRAALSPSQHPAHYDPYRRRSSVQLPPISRMDRSSFATDRPSAPVRRLASPWSPAPLENQRPLPAYQTLSLPPLQPVSPALPSPTSMQLPPPGIAGHSRSAPASPRTEAARDRRMNINNLL
ncbi:uncharacterized protein EI97DRAFT_439719 [Westerdykella ornata]|uniref:Trichome differentiation protein GL1 n=1 Tax=Westerdykella ornata TaxID=318751 RepID=A0A6A6JSW3_WESOR|nr:uncharacterized protein EI97DRAFT_439719 [Westerdykella ornata]KAF2279355.1 hypothetical protein EI97DRAFT_439719 [Westerdykella ornata]